MKNSTMTVEDVTQVLWEEKVVSQDFVIVDFWADWCGFCKQLAPVFDEVSSEITDIPFVKVNVGNEMELSQTYGIQSIPAIKFFCFGKEVGGVTGFRTKTQLIQDIAKVRSEGESCAANSSNFNK